MDYTEFRSLQQQRIAHLRSQLSVWYPQGTRVTLELGCGHGHWLTAYAEAHPDAACLGVDLISQRIRRASAKRDKRDVTGLHFLKADARELLAAWPEERPLEQIFMLFPDPWPKARHHKHRMVQSSLLDRLAELATPGARFHFRSDHLEYVDWTREHLGRHPLWELEPDAPWPWETETIFQKLMDSWQSLVARRTPVPASPDATTSR